jgi:hypothetical protein
MSRTFVSPAAINENDIKPISVVPQLSDVFSIFQLSVQDRDTLADFLTDEVGPLLRIFTGNNATTHVLPPQGRLTTSVLENFKCGLYARSEKVDGWIGKPRNGGTITILR